MALTTQISEIGLGSGVLRGRRLPAHVLTYTVHDDSTNYTKVVRWMTNRIAPNGRIARVVHEMPLDETEESLNAVLAAMQLTD